MSKKYFEPIEMTAPDGLCDGQPIQSRAFSDGSRVLSTAVEELKAEIAWWESRFNHEYNQKKELEIENKRLKSQLKRERDLLKAILLK